MAKWHSTILYKVIKTKLLANKEYSEIRAKAGERMQARFQQAMRFLQVTNHDT